MEFALVFFGELIGGSASFGVLEFGNVGALDITIIVFGFSVGAEGRIGGVLFATATCVLFGGIGFGKSGEVGFGLVGFGHLGMKSLWMGMKSL
jgi:hypothetical protein